MRKYLIAWIMVHIGMILIQGERTFIIVFFRMFTAYVLFRLVVAKKEKNKTKQFRWRGVWGGEVSLWEIEIRLKLRKSCRLNFSFSVLKNTHKRTQRIKIEKAQGKKTNFCHFSVNFFCFVCSSSRPMKQRIRSERA